MHQAKHCSLQQGSKETARPTWFPSSSRASSGTVAMSVPSARAALSPNLLKDRSSCFMGHCRPAASRQQQHQPVTVIITSGVSAAVQSVVRRCCHRCCQVLFYQAIAATIVAASWLAGDGCWVNSQQCNFPTVSAWMAACCMLDVLRAVTPAAASVAASAAAPLSPMSFSDRSSTVNTSASRSSGDRLSVLRKLSPCTT